MYNIFVRNRGWLCIVSSGLTLLLALLVTVTDSQSVVSEAWPYHYYAPAFSHEASPPALVLPTPYHYLSMNRDQRILNIFKKGSSGGLLKGWFPKKSFGVHVTGGLGFSFGGKKEEKKKEESHGWSSYPSSYGWGTYGHGQSGGGGHGHNGWGSYHRPQQHGWGSYHRTNHGQHSYGWGGYDDEYSHDDAERSSIGDLVEADDDDDVETEVAEAEERADLRPRILLLDSLYEDEDEPSFLYSPEVDEYY